jgi:peptide/nickel transport system permease protein
MRKVGRSITALAIVWLVLLSLAAMLSSWLPLPDPLAIDLSVALSPPAPGHWLGTDELGRDLLARLLAAARATLLITLSAAFHNVALGALLGGMAGFFGGWLDATMSFLIDLFWSVPFLVFVVLIVSITGVSPLSLILTIGLINWVTAARIIRAETARLKGMDFVRTARAFGFSHSGVLLRELLPNLRSTLVALAAFSAVEELTLETGLAFLGLSLPDPTPTWGGLLADGLNYLASAWWIAIFTAALVVVTLAALQGLSRGLEAVRLLEGR